MKTYTYMCAMEKGVYDGNETFVSGSFEIGDDTIKDWNVHGWGTISFDKGFEYSSNVGIANLIERHLNKNELRECGYVKTQWADNIPYYLSLTVDGHNYFTNKKAVKKAERKLSRREWRIAVISATIGGMVGLIPWICTLIGGGQ